MLTCRQCCRVGAAPALRRDATSEMALSRSATALREALTSSHRCWRMARVAGAASLYLRASSSSRYLAEPVASPFNLPCAACQHIEQMQARVLSAPRHEHLCTFSTGDHNCATHLPSCLQKAALCRHVLYNSAELDLYTASCQQFGLHSIDAYRLREAKPTRSPNCDSSKPPAMLSRRKVRMPSSTSWMPWRHCAEVDVLRSCEARPCCYENADSVNGT